MKDIEWRVLMWIVVGIVFGAGPLIIRGVEWGVWGLFTLLLYPILLMIGVISLWRLTTGASWWSPFTSLHSFVVLMVAWGLLWSSEVVGIIAISEMTGFSTKIFRVWYENSTVLFLLIAIAYFAQGVFMILWGTNRAAANRSGRFKIALWSLPLHVGVTVVSFWVYMPWLSGDATVLFASHIVLIPIIGLMIADGPWRSPAPDEEATLAS